MNRTLQTLSNHALVKNPLTKNVLAKNALAKSDTAKKYPAKHFIQGEDNCALVEVIRENPLATLIHVGENSELHISHIPFHFNESPMLNTQESHNERLRDNETLLGYELVAHVSNKHPLVEQLKAKNKIDINLVFHGEDDYISPNDVNVEHKAMQRVPTWNYAKVHVSGYATEISDVDAKYQQMIETSDYFEQIKMQQNTKSPDNYVAWSMKSAPSSAIESMLKAITVFTLTITHIEGRFKLSQNKPFAVREQISEHVAKRNKLKIAKQMTAI